MTMIEVDDRGLELFHQYDSVRGICYCINSASRSLDSKSLNQMQYHIEVVLNDLEKCSEIMRALGDEHKSVSFNELFGAFKLIFAANHRLSEFTQGITNQDFEHSDEFGQLARAAYGLFSLINTASNLFEDIIENPPIRNAA